MTTHSTLRTPTKFVSTPDWTILATNDDVSAHFSADLDSLALVDDDSGFIITIFKLNGMDAATIAAKYVF